MANNENLIGRGFDSRTTEEQREIARKGGIASGEARREKANLKKMLLVFLEEDATTDKNGDHLTGAEFMVKIAVREMAKGSPKFWELIRDTAGYKPIDKVQVSEIDPAIVAEVEAVVLGGEVEPQEFEWNGGLKDNDR